MTDPRDPLPTELVAAIRRSTAILYVVARPAEDAIPGSLVVDWGADGVPRRAGALLLRDLAREWDTLADADGEPPLSVDLIAMERPTETTKDIIG